MVDQPDKPPVPPDANDESQASPPPAKEDGPGRKPEGWSTGAPLSWHEPPIEAGSSRPIVVGEWFAPPAGTPESPESPTASPPDQPPASPFEGLPGADPEKSGGWYTPANAQLDALLSGASDTIVEQPDAEGTGAFADRLARARADAKAQPLDGQVPPDDDVTQLGDVTGAPPQEFDGEGWTAADADDTVVLPAGTQPVASASGEPAPPPGSTPVSQDTPAEPGGLTPAEAAFLAEQRQGENQGPDGDGGEPGAEFPAADEPAAEADDGPDRAAPFREVERKVNILRQRYQSGYLTRDELQNELRNLMILDDDGRWWMLGLETNRWYYYDGKDWVPATPPGYDAEPVRGDYARTETGLQEVAVDAGAQIDAASIPLDEDGMPLPERVPQDDPSATLVSPNAPFMEPVRRSEAPTLQGAHQIDDAALLAGGVIEGMTQPTRPDSGMSEDVTLHSGAFTPGAEETAPHGIPVPGAASGDTIAGAAASGAAAEAISKPRPKLGEFPQPDYSLALGYSHNRNTYAKWGIRGAIFATIGGMALTLLVLVGIIGYYFFKVNQYAGAVAELSERAADFETTLILDSEGTTLAEFSDYSRLDSGARTEIPLASISPWLIHATVATENETFYTDPGFSVLAIIRATIQNLREGDTVSGASTITQQLARALVLETEFASQRTNERKIVEIIVASEIKRKYSKNEILEIYLNEIFYGNRAYGIEAAAQTYFNKPASQLNPAEAAFLAGLPQSPATYDPVINREAAFARMQTVLRLMSEANGTGCIRIEHQDATEWAVPNGGALCITAREESDGSTSYYYQTPNMTEPVDMVLDIANVEIAAYHAPEFEAQHPHFVNYVWQQLEAEYGSQAIYAAGFRVYTTLNESIQRAAEQAVAENLATLRSRGVDAENASVVAVRPSDGAVLAMVGSADYDNEDIDGQVNVAFTAQQPGSSIKPFVYLTAFTPDEQGRYWTPATVIWDVYTDFNGYVPLNYDRTYHGPQSARASLANSLNVPAVKALNYTGLLRFTEMAERFGLRFPLGNPVERNAGLPTALGAVEVRLFDMVNAYATLANNGRRVSPYSILFIEDSKGNEIYRADTSPQGEQIVQPELAFLVTSILSDNEARAAEFGRGWPLELQGGRIAAVKTGTTDDSRDIWTVGYTPQFAVGVWVGNTDNRPMYGITGYGGAAPIWNAVMEAAHQGLTVEQFNPPGNLMQIEVCADSGAQPSPACAGRTRWEIFANSAPPPGPNQDIFRTVEVDSFTGKLVNDYCRDEVETRSFLAIDDSTAYNWINNTGEGNAWAQARGLELPVMPPPTEFCDPNEPRPVVVLDFPTENMTVEGVLPLRGAITMPEFNRYEVRLGTGHNAESFGQAVIVEQTQWPQGESVIGQIDTRNYENGPYTIRLVVIDNFGRDVARTVNININNPQPTAEPTAFPTATPAPTLTPPAPDAGQQPGIDAVPTTDPNMLIASPTLAPTLTPTWTLTPTPQ